MIHIKDVLTATPVILERIPSDVNLSGHVGPLIQGLNVATVSIDGYTLENIATKLPDETKENTEHDLLMTESATKIATIIRESLKIIKTHVIPSCDLIEKKIKAIGTPESITDMMFGKLFLQFHHVSNTLFDSSIFPSEPDPVFQNGTLFNTGNVTKLGKWPEASYEEILTILSAASHYPELHSILKDKHAVLAGWNALGNETPWLETIKGDISPKDFDIQIRDLNKVIVLSLLVNKFAGTEDPYTGVTGISLDDYRHKLNRLKAFLNTILYFNKVRYNNRFSSGLIIHESHLKYEKCDNKESHFYGTDVLNGGVDVIYNDVLADYFANSADYSLSTVVVGILYSKHTKQRLPAGDFFTLLPYYKEQAESYMRSLETRVIINIRTAVKSAINSALSELANGPLWSEYLSEDGQYKNLFYRLEDLIKIQGNIWEILTLPSVINLVRSGDVAVANTMVAPIFANVLGAPIAAEILSNNIQSEAVIPERQRKLAGKAVAKVVVEKLLAK